ncbi:hypothetical protein [Ruixingdingia sedimenti]|uniref:Transferrin-binding protein B C-lobe/N-lobe beta barrel domain-containing protein n=1 Tax=Ruixingdingia sedimenti TaxID=3073604 RepID=A0ABU1FCE7_9RHOB|nr:hypothetical protein [Xinfangfangia sp. LG-4]MDR5654545.1 hypothetical protein [Xinfangfangia sp. LG-4]
MFRTIVPLLAVAVLAACSGNPIGNGGGDPTDPTDPPEPTARDAIERYEPQDGRGSGHAAGMSYDAATNTFTVANLGFDGNNAYTESEALKGVLGPYRVYESSMAYADSVTGQPIDQFMHRALLGASDSGDTEFAIVRTGAYRGYGFGGFVYKRNGGVVLPASGQAAYSGQYAGIRDFDGRSGLEYTTGDMDMAIDFRGFSGDESGAAVQGFVRNRTIRDIDGNDITQQVLNAMTAESGRIQTELPILAFAVGPGVMNANGEIRGTLDSSIMTTDGVETFETGNYYAILSGDDAQEVVGVIVVTGDDPRRDGVTARETGGFILYRPLPPAP